MDQHQGKPRTGPVHDDHPRRPATLRSHAVAGRRTLAGARAAVDAASSAARRATAPARPAGRRPRLANTRRRARALFLVTLFVISIFAAQLLRLQFFEAGTIAAKAEGNRSGKAIDLPAQRGRILDAKGVVLADSVERRTVVSCAVWVAQYERTDPVTDKKVEVGTAGAAQDLAPLLGMGVDELTQLLTPRDKKDCYRVIKKGVEPLTWRKIDALKVAGISSEVEPQRTYPGGAATAPLVGLVGADGQATASAGTGLELVFNKDLTGTKGTLRAEYSIDGRIIPMADRQVVPPVPGRDVKLTIDNDLQWYAYNQIAGLVQARKAKSGYVVVMDKKGRIKAAAQYPSFDPATRPDDGQYMPLPFSDVFEPGSTAKVMSIGASLDQGVTSPEAQYVVQNRLSRPQAGITIADMHDHAALSLTATGILAVSSNIGTAMIAEKMSAQTLYDYQQKFGLGSTSATGMPGESQGLFTSPEKMDGAQRYTVMYGQGVSVTAVQATNVYQAIANGGVRVPATLVEGVADETGQIRPAPLPEGVRAIKPETATTLLKMMENVTNEGGTAVGAEIPGYRVAGKTGTADIAEKGKYSGKNALSFIGIAPADSGPDDPGLITSVVLQAPDTNSSSVVAPVFRSVMTFALQDLKIPPTGTSLDPYPNFWGAQASRNKTR